MSNDQITIMFVRQSGKIRTIKIAFRKLIYLGCGVIGLVAAVAFLLHGYINLYEETVHLRAQVTADNSDPLLAFQNVPATPPSLPVTESSPEPTPTVRQTTQSQALPDLESATDTHTEFIHIQDATLGSNVISVGNFSTVFSPEKQDLNVKFRISNNNGEGRISGFLAIIVDQGNAVKRLDRFVTFPAITLDATGKITDFREGDWFAIERWKPIEAEISLQCRDHDIDQISIFVFSAEGDLLLKQVYAPMQAAT